MEFANKEYLFLLLLIIPYILWYVMWRKKTEPTIRMADTFALQRAQRTWRVRLMPVQAVLRIVAFTLLVLAMARPQMRNSWEEQTIEGIDIMLAIDVSSSMLSEDIEPNRIEAAKKVAAEFISDRSNDNIGLTVFAGEAFTQCPMTIDHSSLLSLLQNSSNYVGSGAIIDMTAIGMGLTNAVSRLKDSKAKSRVVILLTDGSNNYGEISPLTAADMARSLGIRIYTIGVGADGSAMRPMTIGGTVQHLYLPNEIDEETLRKIAQATNGRYYRATNAEELRQIYSDIDKLEKSKLDVQRYSKVHDVYQNLVLAAIIALLLEILLRITIFRRIP
ncbi:MAG: VWA domain-containing protein [Prevotella sp.]|nr:VWA domain-containing protein [Prevotella sp.]MBR6998180.1 VWA domain-containing protein [Prevotella sp.]